MSKLIKLAFGHNFTVSKVWRDRTDKTLIFRKYQAFWLKQSMNTKGVVYSGFLVKSAQAKQHRHDVIFCAV